MGLAHRLLEGRSAADAAHAGRLGLGLLLPTALLETRGARTGQVRRNGVIYFHDGERVTIIASKLGMPEHPAWFHNLRANPHVTYEVGTRTVRATARVTKGEERERIWSKQKRDRPNFAEYEKKTTRQIPVIVLEPEA